MNRRKTSIFSLILLFLVSGMAHAALEFEQTTVEHEASLVEEQSKAVFRFTNTGDTTVAITDLKSSCGCTVPTLEKKTYEPGESGEITALFTFGQRSGRQLKKVTVQTDDPNGKVHSLQFITHIPEWGSIEPRILRWRIGEAPAEQEFQVTVVDPGRIELKGPAEPVNFTLQRVDSDSDKAIFKVTPNSTDERVTEAIKFELLATDGDASRIHQLIVYCLIR